MKIKEIINTVPTKAVTIDGNIVNIKQYLLTNDKMELINTIQDQCLNVAMVDQAHIDALFNALVITYYTDIEIEADVDLIDVYDYFEINDYMTIVINAIPKNEYEALIEYVSETINDYNRYKASILGALEGIVSIAPALMERVNEISKDIDIESLKEIGNIYQNFK